MKTVPETNQTSDFNNSGHFFANKKTFPIELIYTKLLFGIDLNAR